MRVIGFFIAVNLLLATSLIAQDQSDKQAKAAQGDAWKKLLPNRSKRGTLHDASQQVRGDSGKWNDDPKLLHMPPLSSKPANLSLDDWYDRLQDTRHQRLLTPSDENWLFMKTRQLDDNDRVWIERIERHGNKFTVTSNEAIWRGRYQKTFTYYNVFGINLGKLAPGKYQAKWVIKPLVFKQFEGNGRPRNEDRSDNWSKDERSGDSKPVELKVAFQIAAS